MDAIIRQMDAQFLNQSMIYGYKSGKIFFTDNLCLFSIEMEYCGSVAEKWRGFFIG